MSISRTLRVGGAAVAMLGFSACDPAPPPLDCTTVDKGQTLKAEASLSGQTLTVTIHDDADATWTGTPAIVGPITGATPVSVTFDASGDLSVVLTIDAGATSGTFTLSALVQGFAGPACQVERTFQFTISSGGDVTVATADTLPLGAAERATIVVMRREGRDVELHASGATRGATVGWTATGGAVDTHAAERVTWRLPEEPGLYQMELLVDRGREGLSVDTLVIEVG